MAEARKSNISPQSGTTPSDNGGEPGCHPQQMQHQPFSYRVKYQIPSGPGLPQQRPLIVSYEQHSASQQQQGSYVHHAPYQQFPHQQQHQLQQQQLQQQQHQQQQQMHQQLQQIHQQQQQQIHFGQQSENVQQSMQYVKDMQKLSRNQTPPNINSADEEISEEESQGIESSVVPTKVEEKSDNRTDVAVAKEVSQTPAEVERLAKELDAVRAAHEKQVKELEAQIKALHEQKSEKEVKYLRVPSSAQKKKEPNKSPTKNTRRRSTLDGVRKEDQDTSGGVEADYGFDTCPSPAMSVNSDVSIKEEPEDDPPFKIQGVFPQGSNEKDTKTSIDKEIAKSGPDIKSPKTYTLSVTDFDYCIFCQKTTQNKMTHLLEDHLPLLQSVVLNVDCEVSNRLKDYVFDMDMFFNNLPQYHCGCFSNLKNKFKSFRRKRKEMETTNLSLCVFCQEHTCESLKNFTVRGFESFQEDLSKMDNEQIEKLKNIFNFDRIKTTVTEEAAKEEHQLKLHKNCRLRYRVKNRPRKKQNISISELENKDHDVNLEDENDNAEITPDEETFKLLADREKTIEELKLKKIRKDLPEPKKFEYKIRCIICGNVSSGKGGKFRIVRDHNTQRTRDNAIINQHSDILKILEHAKKCDIDMFSHSNCFTKYNYKNTTRVIKGTRGIYEKSFKAVITEIEDPMFRYGKVFNLLELREKFLKFLIQNNVESTMKMCVFTDKIKTYYTFGKKDKKCRVTVIPHPYCLIYSSHLRESQVTSQINALKKEPGTEDLLNTNKDSAVGEPKKKKKLRFSCEECGYKCLKKKTYESHIKKHELRSLKDIIKHKQAMCEICGKMLKNKVCLKAHMRIHSSKKFSCTQCDKSYYNKSSLSDHLMVHKGVKNFVCPECGKKFYAKSNVTKHVRKVHRTAGKPFLCTVCGKSFKLKERLQEHSNKHSGARPFVCKECGKSFRYRSNLRTHLLAHEGKKPKMCSICSFGCYTNENLRLHMIKHTGDNKQIMFSSNEEVNEKSCIEKYIHLDEDIPKFKSQTYFPL